MRFIDEATILVRAGHGGPGAVAFRRETMEPRGGPAGGDGGRGGSVYLVADTNLSTLLDFRFKRKYHAQDGVKGMGKRQDGPDGQDIRLHVPIGTVVKDADSGELIAEILSKDDEPFLLCRGGRGGKGNTHFATSTHQTPRFAQPGEEGQIRNIMLELKLLADVGLLGFPNAGKSSLISAISAARPKVADYPFTTLVPNLGVVRVDENRNYVVADVPGLIEGASKGAGLGLRFLKHLERTRVFLHMLDVAVEGDPGIRYDILRHELQEYNPHMLEHYEVVVFNKIDALQGDDQIKFVNDLEMRLRSEGKDVLRISVATRAGLQELLNHLTELLYARTPWKNKKISKDLPDAAYIS
jgi:GTPase